MRKHKRAIRRAFLEQFKPGDVVRHRGRLVGSERIEKSDNFKRWREALKKQAAVWLKQHGQKNKPLSYSA